MYQDHFEEVERTEMIKDTLDPQWVRKVEIDYRFEERQVGYGWRKVTVDKVEWMWNIFNRIFW